LLYRRNHIGQKNRSSVNNRTGGPGTVGRSIAHEKMHEYAQQQQPIKSDSVDKLSPSERWLKVKEFETLANKHRPAHIAKQMTVMVAIGNDDFLEKNLATLRDIDRNN
jgi:hypothetical protein